MRQREREDLSEGKKNTISALISKYDIQEALKDLLGGTIKEMMETKIDHHLGYEMNQRSDNTHSHNRCKPGQLEAIMVK